MTTAATFDDVYTRMSEAQAEIRRGRDVIAKALTSGIEKIREESDFGQMAATGMYVRYLATDDLTPTIDTGDAIDVRMSGGSWHPFRVGAKQTTGGVARLALEAEFK